ncbi:MAG: beta-ketoacyl-ACP synthase III, partial [Stellaceae bacterium]
MPFRSIVRGCGAYLPARIVTNDELARRLETSDEWIVQRTGIRQRHVAADGEFTSDLATKAAERALASAGMAGSDLDLIVLATATPDHTFPATAAKVQGRLGMRRCAAFDVQAVCTGFIYALSVADNAIRAGQAKRALVIGAETFSRILDWNDRGTCVLFGDGAGALVLEAGPDEGGSATRGVLSTHLHSDGSGYELLYVDGGPSTNQKTGFVRMEGREIFRNAVQRLAEVVDEALTANRL